MTVCLCECVCVSSPEVEDSLAVAEGEDEGVLVTAALPDEEVALGSVKLCQHLLYCVVADWSIEQVLVGQVCSGKHVHQVSQ